MNKKPRIDLTALASPTLHKALCDPTRLALLAWLARQKTACSVSEIARSGTAVDLSVVSRHLAVLRDAGLLAATRQGKSVLYRVDATSIVASLRRLADALEACCATNPKTETS